MKLNTRLRRETRYNQGSLRANMALPTRYSKLPARDSEDSIENVLLSQAEWPTQGKRSVTTKAGWSLLVFLVGTMTFAAGLIVGIKSVPSGARSMQASAQNFMSELPRPIPQQREQRSTHLPSLGPPGDLSYPMIYNITYTQNSPSSNSLWDAMFPRGVGFVKHPSISPDLSGLAVFHELHCVVSIPLSPLPPKPTNLP